MSRYSLKQLEKYRRQKYISVLEKITKNLFQMFKDEKTTINQFKKKFDALVIKLNKLEKIRLNSEYLQETKSYIDNLYSKTANISDQEFRDIKLAEVSNLNRLQKLKQRLNYKKDKHRHGERDQDWGESR